jgi:hypothetical protein
MVNNARKWKSPELRFTFGEAEQLLNEIQELQNKLAQASIPTPKTQTPLPEVKTISLDGGGFKAP